MAEIKNAPQPTIERISSLINRIQSGDIKIPQFQRGFIWKEHQVKTLLDSIYEGYPISSLLFWLTSDRIYPPGRSLDVVFWQNPAKNRV